MGATALFLRRRGEFRSLHQLHHHQADRKNAQHRDDGPRQQVFSDSTHLTSFVQLCLVFTLPRRDREGFRAPQTLPRQPLMRSFPRDDFSGRQRHVALFSGRDQSDFSGFLGQVLR